MSTPIKDIRCYVDKLEDRCRKEASFEKTDRHFVTTEIPEIFCTGIRHGLQELEAMQPQKPASWHACFIAEQRAAGQVQPHLLAMLEVLLQEAEREYGGELPEGWWCKSPNGWHLIWKNAGNIVSLNLAVSGTLQLVTMDETLLLFEPSFLAAALRELWPKEEA